MKRLKCTPALAQFFDPLDKGTCKKVYQVLEAYSPETKKKERLKKEAENKVKNDKKDKKRWKKTNKS